MRYTVKRKRNAAIFWILPLLIIGSAGFGQISEEFVIPSSAHSDDEQCIPPCRKGFFCKEGECISKCNPPCPDGTQCGDDGECRPVTASIRKVLTEIDRITRVATREELLQGAMVQTNKEYARVQILDTVFECEGELYLNLPKGEFDLSVDAPGYFVNEEDVDVRLGKVDTVEVRLRRYQLNASMAFGASSMKGFSLLAGEFNLGVGLFTRVYAGLTASYVGPLGEELTILTDHRQSDLPDTLRKDWPELFGLGASLGYLGIPPIANRIKIIPQAAVGYWEYDDQVYYLNRYQTGDTEYIKALEQHDIDKYYVRPTVQVRVGEGVFNFDGRISAFFGSGAPIYTFLAGFVVGVPR